MKCPICGKYKEHKNEMIEHVENMHRDSIPTDMSTAQYLYMSVHGRPYGLCRVCGQQTPWNEKAGKPSQLCGKESCRKTQRKKAYDNMMKVYGKPSLLTDPYHQQKMLANRKISGTYVWSDHKHKFTYTGSYEKYAIEWLDKVMMLNPDKIQMPGPVIPYEIDGEIKNWLTDIYLEDFNLIIEIKDGGDMKNTHPGFAHNRELEAAKDECMKNQKQYNYIKVTNKDMMSLLKTLTDIKMNNIFDNDKKVDNIIAINESVSNNNLSINEAIEFCEQKLSKDDDELYVLICSYDDKPTGIAIINKDFNNLFRFKNNIKTNKTKLYKVKLNSKIFNMNSLFKFRDFYYNTDELFNICEKMFKSDISILCNKLINDIIHYLKNENKSYIKSVGLVYDGDNCSIKDLPKKVPEIITEGYLYKDNSEIAKLYDSFITENSIADLSPIVKSASMESSNDVFKFGNGASTVIPTGHDYNVVQDPMIEDSEQKWSNHPADNTPDPFVWSNNFIMKEMGELRTDIKNDPSATSGSITDITKDIYSSNFIV